MLCRSFMDLGFLEFDSLNSWNMLFMVIVAPGKFWWWSYLCEINHQVLLKKVDVILVCTWWETIDMAPKFCWSTEMLVSACGPCVPLSRSICLCARAFSLVYVSMGLQMPSQHPQNCMGVFICTSIWYT